MPKISNLFWVILKSNTWPNSKVYFSIFFKWASGSRQILIMFVFYKSVFYGHIGPICSSSRVCLSSPFNLSRGLRQFSPLSPCLPHNHHLFHLGNGAICNKCEKKDFGEQHQNILWIKTQNRFVCGWCLVLQLFYNVVRDFKNSL